MTGEPRSEDSRAAQVAAIAAERADEPGSLIEILHEIQAEFGYIDDLDLGVVAEQLNLSRAEVRGVVSFYRDFRREPPAETRVRICRAEACQSIGGRALAEDVADRLGLKVGTADAASSVSLDEVFCLGNCALAPSATIDDRLVGRATGALVEWLVTAGFPAPPEIVPPRTEHAVIVRVPVDSGATSVGAFEVSDEIRRLATERSVDVRIVRNGSRGLYWLEPLVEVETADGRRVAYGPVRPSDVEGLWEAGFLTGGRHRLRLGPTDDIPWLARQQRVTFARVGVIDPLSAAEYERAGGLAGLRAALERPPQEIVSAVVESGLRGRGGAGFPAGVKWAAVAAAPTPDVKYVCCNADEGDSGTFADRMLMEGDPFTIIEAMVIAGIAVGSGEGYVYIRSEYPDAVETMLQAVELARENGWLGPDVLGSGHAFDLQIRVGAGSYVCGEESAMLESLEGKRGVVRSRPPLPAIAGLFGRPTLVNNVLTLAAVPWIMANGAQAYQSLGAGRSRGTQVFQLAGNVKRGGIVEVGFGVTLDELVNGFGGGTASGRPIRAVQVGGPLGAYLPASALGVAIDYESLLEAGGMLGHGGIVVFDDTVDMAQQARYAMEFCAEESCGKCTPCRVGSVRGVEVIDRIIAGDQRAANLAVLEDLCEVMTDGSLCAMGGLTPMPVRSAIQHFPEDFSR